MQIDVLDVTTRILAVVVLVTAVACVVMIWMAATGHPVFHIPWVETHHGA